MTDNKNTILAIVLSAVVLIAWQYFYAVPNAEKQKLVQQQQQAQQLAQKQATAPQPAQATQPGQTPATPAVPGATQPTAAAAPLMTRAAALATSPRIPIDTVSLQGSIALKGGRIDDLALLKFRETVDPKSPPITLLSPSGSPEPFYAEFGWTAAHPGVKVPGADTLWTQSGSGALDVGHPVTLTWDNGAGLDIPPRHLGRRQVPVHRQGRSHQQVRQAGLALSLRADFASRPAQDRRLLHPA